MPVIKGFGTRAEDGREHGRATIIIGFPDARRHVPRLDAAGKIVVDVVPNPHQRAMDLEDLRTMIKSCAPGNPNLEFFTGAEKALLTHIESAAQPATSRHDDVEKPGFGIGAPSHTAFH